MMYQASLGNWNVMMYRTGDFATGIVDNPISAQIREKFDLNGGIDICSDAYNAGGFAGLVAGVAALAASLPKLLSKGAKAGSKQYAPRVRQRGLEGPVSHNFPYSFDDAILSTKPIPKSNGYKIFQETGTMNGENGVFEIGVRSDGVIDHRFSGPVKK
ncbi:MAG: hypothetical protein GY811_09965 [Myxococcales bacterium]|nr:hypothetical protein [Myxococcales bacterium]